MSIRKRLLLSNIAIVIVPFLALLLLEMIIGFVLIRYIKMETGQDFQTMFRTFHLIGIPIILIATNGLLTYFVSKSVLRPIEKLSKAAERISEGNLDSPIQPMGNDELGKLAQTFEMMRLKLKESADLQFKYEQNRKELIANISHDLKTPITSIKGYVEGIQDGVANTPEKMDRYIQTIYTKSMDLDHLIDELFLFSRLDLHSIPFHFERLSLFAYFEDLIEEMRYELKEKDIAIKLSADAHDDYLVMVDSEQLKRIVMNIIQNSIKHMDKCEKELIVHLKESVDEVVVQIQDNGKGIHEEMLPYLFDQFFRVDLSRRSGEGSSGLGLAIVKRIVEQHGGRVWAESEIGVGTSIFFTFPRVMKKKVSK